LPTSQASKPFFLLNASGLDRFRVDELQRRSARPVGCRPLFISACRYLDANIPLLWEEGIHQIGEKPQQRPAFLVRCEQMSQRAEACRKKVKPTVRHGSF
jgi:hypothetical protein